MTKLKVSALMEIDDQLYQYLARRYSLKEVDAGVVTIESMDFLFLLRELLTSHVRQEAVASDLAKAVTCMTASIENLTKALSQMQSQQVQPTSQTLANPLAVMVATSKPAEEQEPVKTPVTEVEPAVEPEPQSPLGPRKINPALTAQRAKKLMGGI